MEMCIIKCFMLFPNAINCELDIIEQRWILVPIDLRNHIMSHSMNNRYMQMIWSHRSTREGWWWMTSNSANQIFSRLHNAFADIAYSTAFVPVATLISFLSSSVDKWHCRISFLLSSTLKFDLEQGYAKVQYGKNLKDFPSFCPCQQTIWNALNFLEYKV